MGPFLTFVAIIAIIWTLSGIASAQNKRREMERRRMLQMQLQRSGVPPQRSGVPPQRRPTAQPARRISQGIAARFPDVLLPPAAPPPRQPRPVQQQRRGPMPPQRRVAQPPRRGGGGGGGRPIAAPVESSMAASRPPAYQASAPLSTAAPALASVTAARQTAAMKAVDASAVARWATPATLRQQFILTEIFQPPLALRDQRDQR